MPNSRGWYGLLLLTAVIGAVAGCVVRQGDRDDSALRRELQQCKNDVRKLSEALERRDPHPVSIPREPEPKQVLAWITRGSGAFAGDRGKAFYGVGSASRMIDASKQRDRANMRARLVILQLFNEFISFAMKDYQEPPAAETEVLEAQKAFRLEDIMGAQVVDNWRDPDDGTIYSLAILDLYAITQMLSGRAELKPELREFFRSNAERIFSELVRRQRR